MLEDHADAAPQADQRVLVQAADVDAVDPHLAGAGPLQHVDRAQQGRLAGAAAADDAEHLAAPDGKGDIGQRRYRALRALVAFLQSVENDVGVARRVGGGPQGRIRQGNVVLHHAVFPSRPRGGACRPANEDGGGAGWRRRAFRLRRPGSPSLRICSG